MICGIQRGFAENNCRALYGNAEKPKFAAGAQNITGKYRGAFPQDCGQRRQQFGRAKFFLSSKQRLFAFAEKTGVPENYLTILKREMGNLEQKPLPLADFPGVLADTVSALLSKGIKTSKDVYDLSVTPENIASVSDKFDIEAGALQELNALCDLVRINGVGVAAARTLYEGGYKGVGDIANAKAEELLKAMNDVNAGKQYYKATLGEKDMQFIIDAANILISNP